MNASKPRTAIVHYTAPPVVGGVESVMAAHARVFTDAGYPVDIVAGRGDKKALPEGVGLQIIPEMDTQYPAIQQISAELSAGCVPPEFQPMADQLAQSLKQALAPYSVVIFHNIFTKHFNLPLTAAVWTLIDAGVPWKPIAWCHDLSWTSAHSRTQLHADFPWELLRRYDPKVTYVTISEDRRRDLGGMLGAPVEKIHVAYNGVDPLAAYGLSGDSQRIVEDFDLLESDLILLMPVRTTEAKNIELACRVAAELQKHGLKLRIVVTGPPDPHDPASLEYYHTLLGLRSELGVEESMRFVYELDDGLRIGQETVNALYRVADLVFIPSQREGFGMPVLEAGLAGLPVFSTPIPASVELGKGDVHLLQWEDTPEAIAGQILTWADSDPIYQMKKRVRQQFTWKAIFKQQILPLISDGKLA